MKIFKIFNLALCCVFLLSQTVYSEVKLGKDLTLTPSVGVASQKISGTSGVVANRNQPSYNAGLSLNHTSGLYALYSVARDQQDRVNVATLGNYSYEACGVVGINKGFDQITLDFSFEDCYVNQRNNKHTGTFYTNASFAATKELDFSFGIFRDDTDGGYGANGTAGVNRYLVGKEGYNFGANLNLPLAKSSFKYGYSDKNTEWMKISVSKEFAGVNFDLALWDVSSESDANFISSSDQKVNNRTHVILNVSKSF